MPRSRRRDISPAEIPKAHRIWWWIAAVVAFAFVLGFAIAPYVELPRGFLEEFSLKPAPESAITWVIIQTVGIAISTVLMLYFIGKARLENAAYRADRIDIQAFTDERDAAGAALDGYSAAELTARFKHVLNGSRLYTPTPVPGVGVSYDFIQIVENAGEAAEGWWRVATRLVKLVQPPAAFRIGGTIRSGADGTYRLVLELVRVPRFAASPIVIEDDSWMRVLHRAANAVAALVLPRSKYGRNNIYWAAWRNAKIPDALFDAYQHANHLVEHRRYDEALGEYHRALAHDPSNVYIRLEIAAVQEQLDLHLDALATYDDVVTICSRGQGRLGRWWRVTPVGERQSRRTRRQQDTAMLVARYRHALVLGLGDTIASAWWVRLPRPGADPVHDTRVRRRADLRTMLRMRFSRYLAVRIVTDTAEVSQPYRVRDHARVLDADVAELVDTPGKQAELTGYVERAAALRSYLCALSQYEIERILVDYGRFRVRHWIRWRRLSRVLSMNALRLCLVWIVLRRAMADIDDDGESVPRPRPADPAPWRKVRLPKLFTDAKWPPHHSELAAAVNAVTRRGFGHRSSWSECYNAACVYAVAMLNVGSRGRTDGRWPRGAQPQLHGAARDTVASLAVDELYHAAMASHSGRLAAHRSWLVDEDLDLAALRDHPRFRMFEMVTFAPDRPAPVRPLRSHVWEQATYLRQLVSDMANCRAHFWRTRADAPTPFDEYTVDAWRRADHDAWLQLRDLAVSRQDWYARHEAILAYRRWAKEAGLPAKIAGYPAYSDTLLSTQYGSYHGERCEPLLTREAVDDVAGRYVKDCDTRLDQLVGMVPSLSAEPLVPKGLPRLPGTAARRQRLEFGRRTARWTALSAWFDDCSASVASAAARRAELEGS